MTGKYARLKSGWMLRGWDNMPLALVNWVSSDSCELTQKAFYVAASCDGQTDFDSFRFLPEHRAVLDKFIEKGMAELCHPGHSIEPWQRFRKAPNPRILGIHWCVTGLCNLRCGYCCMETSSGRYGELPFDAMAGLVDQFERANVIEVSLSGGEPFLRKDLLDIIALLSRKKIQLKQIYSNGLLITDEHIEGIRGLGFMPGFQISFDGVGTHDRMRGGAGTEHKVVAAVRRLRAAGLSVTVSTSVDRRNIGCLADTYELVRRLGVRSWRISSPQEMGDWKGSGTTLSVEEELEAYAPLLERWLRDGKAFGLQLGNVFRDSLSEKEGAGPRGPGFTPDDYDCGACREYSCLLPDGTLVPCPGYVDNALQQSMPNLLREDLSSVLKDSLVRRIADMKKRDLLASNPECAGCELFRECGMGCRVSALVETGNLKAKDPLVCRLYKEKHKARFRRMAASAS